MESGDEVLGNEWFAVSAEKFDPVIVIDFAEVKIFYLVGAEDFVYLEDAGIDEFDFLSALAGDFYFHPQRRGDLSESIRDAELVHGFAITEELEVGYAGGGGEVVEVLGVEMEAGAFDFL